MKKNKNKNLTTNILYGVIALLLIGASVGILNCFASGEKEEKHLCNNYTISKDAVVFDIGPYVSNEENDYFYANYGDYAERYDMAVSKGHNKEDKISGGPARYVSIGEINYCNRYIQIDLDSSSLQDRTKYSISLVMSYSNSDFLSHEFISFGWGYNDDDGGGPISIVTELSYNYKEKNNDCEFKEFNFRKITLWEADYYTHGYSKYLFLAFDEIPDNEYLYLSQIVFEPIGSVVYSLRNSHQNLESEGITYHNDDDESERHIEWGPLF